MVERNRCTCHDLSAKSFRAACAAGCTTVKACFRHHRCLPKCAECIPMVRRIVHEAQADDTAHSFRLEQTRKESRS